MIIARLSDKFQGFTLSLGDLPLLRINGNDPTYKGPILLLSIDPYSLFALSRPETISRILVEGPQILITTKDIAHKLFEHGMKCCLGTQRFKYSEFQATLKSYYNQANRFEIQAGMTISVETQSTGTVALIESEGYEPVTIREKGEGGISLDYLKTYLEVPRICTRKL